MKIKRILGVLIFSLCTLMTYGQNSNDARAVTSTYLIKNVNVVQSPGHTLPISSVLIVDGLITKVAKSITPPYDAKVIDADSLYLYAAFIDAASHTGIEKKDEEKPDVEDSGNPPNSAAGITPQQRAADLIVYSEKSIKKMREAGYGYLHVMPRGRMMPGYSAIISTGESTREDMLLHQNTAFYSQLRSASGVYPNTVIGVMSKYRDLYKNAENLDKYNTLYSKNPKGISRPSTSAELQALAPVVNRKTPVYFHAQKARDIFKVITLKKDLGFDLVLTNIRQGNKLINKIKALRVPVILSLQLPKEIKDKKDKDKDESTKKDKKDKTTEDDVNDEKKVEKSEEADKKKETVKEKSKEEEEVSPEKKAYDKRKMESYTKYESQAAEFAEAGVPFAFSTLSSKPKDTKSSILRMMKRGLTADQALAALTTNAANLMNLSAVAGTVEAGKLGNIFISDKPYFTEKSKIKYSIIDGKLYQYEEKKKKSDGEKAVDGLEGTWAYAIEIPGQEQSGKMKISKDGDSYEIKLNTADDPGDWEEAFDVEVDGDKLTFGLNVEADGFELHITADLVFDEDTYEGTMNITEFGTFPIAGSKIDGPK